MSETTSKKLQLIFANGDGGQSMLSPKYFKDEFVADPDEVMAWMDKFCALDVFHHQGKDVPLYTSKKTARIVKTVTTDIF